MSDRELLELAAKAADLPVDMDHEGGIGWFACGTDAEGDTIWWNPLKDDGDALRLAVRLRLSIDHNHTADQQRWVAADRNGCEGCYSPVSCVEDEFDEQDRSFATRRAIVRAAAAIAQQSQGEGE